MDSEILTREELQSMAIHRPLSELYAQMLGEVDIIKVLQQTSTVVEQIFDTEHATIYRVVEETQELESIGFIGNICQRIRVPIRESSLAGYCALKETSFAIPDAYGDLSEIDSNLKFDDTWDKMNDFRTRDVMCTPAIFKGEVMGVVQVINSKNKNTFSKSDIIQLDSVSRFVAYALYHAKLYDELATLKCLEKEKAEFMKIVVHELKAPVSASKSMVSALLFTNKEDAKLSKVLGKIETRMDELLNMVQDVLSLSQVKAGRPLGDVVVCDLCKETEQIFNKYTDEAEIKGLEMDLSIPDSEVNVRIDKQGCNLILSNLISNAVKYTPEGSVQVSLRNGETEAVIKVKDSGIGIPAADLPDMFNEFFRASNARNSDIKGTGVGLAGIKDMVERFNGKMELLSQENKGSTFIVRLPLYNEK
ncbi:MAG: GAF domain-containing sensor histidine kinase [Planctomycetota bacterium]|jgi:signal transduction histidine kinase